MFLRTQIQSLLAPTNGAKINSTTVQLPLIEMYKRTHPGLFVIKLYPSDWWHIIIAHNR